MGEGPPPLTPWAWGWGRDGGSGLVPCRTRSPAAQASWGQQQPPEACRKGLCFCSPTSTTGGQQRLGLGLGATGVGLSPAQQQQILGTPRQGLAGQWGQGSCLSLCQGQPSEAKQPSWTTWPQCRRALHHGAWSREGPCMQTQCTGPSPAPLLVASGPPTLAGLTSPNLNFPEE